MIRSISVLIFVVVCFVSSSAQTPEGKQLIDEINAARVKVDKLFVDAEHKRSEAHNKSADKAEHDRLIEEAAKLYGQISDTLEQAANKAKELSKLQTPPWYEEYFGLQSKLIGNLAHSAANAHDELLIRKSGGPSESQLQSWKDDIKRMREENEDLRKRIAAIESREGVVLIKD